MLSFMEEDCCQKLSLCRMKLIGANIDDFNIPEGEFQSLIALLKPHERETAIRIRNNSAIKMLKATGQKS